MKKFVALVIVLAIVSVLAALTVPDGTTFMIWALVPPPSAIVPPVSVNVPVVVGANVRPFVVTTPLTTALLEPVSANVAVFVGPFVLFHGSLGAPAQLVFVKSQIPPETPLHV